MAALAQKNKRNAIGKEKGRIRWIQDCFDYIANTRPMDSLVFWMTVNSVRLHRIFIHIHVKE